MAFNLSSSPSGSPHASENNRTTFGPSQPPCKLKTKTKVCHDTQEKEKKKATTMAQNRKENTHNTPTPKPKIEPLKNL